ncbi:MAG: hypothetical protein ACR2GY_12595 [Phycisphaerales bacterium]
MKHHNRILPAVLAATSLMTGMSAFAADDHPVLDAATFSGADTLGFAMCQGADGSIFVVGLTDDPALPGALNTKTGHSDMYVMKFSGDLTTLHWSRYMGGTGEIFNVEVASDCASTHDGGVVVTGRTETPDFPTLNAIDTSLDGPSDVALFKLDADGNIVFSTYIGGSGDENPRGSISNFGTYFGEVEIAADGAIVLAGTTRSPDFPTVNAIDDTFGGFFPDAFVMKLTADGQTILASTFLGDEFQDDVWDMTLDSEDRPVLVGGAGPGWPQTAGGYSHGNRTSSGIIHVTKLAADISAVDWVAWIKRIGDTGGRFNFFSLAIAPNGTVTAVGQAGDRFPPMPPDAYQPALTGGSPTRDIFALSFSADGSELTAGTYLGRREAGEFSVAVGVDSFGQIIITENFEKWPPTRFYKFDPQLTTRLEGPVLLAQPGTTVDALIDEMNNLLVLIAGDGDTTKGAFSRDPEGAYIARWNMQDPPDNTPVPAELTDVTVAFGSLISGGLPEISRSDDVDLIGRSQFGFLSSEPNVFDLRVGAATAVDPAEQIDLAIEARLNNPNGNVNLRLRNFNTGGLQSVHTYILGTTETRETASVTPAAQFVRSSDGRIELSMKTVVIATFSTSGFRVEVDHVEMSVR